MLNAEKYKDEIIKTDGVFAVQNGTEIVSCATMNCEKCDIPNLDHEKSCFVCRILWLLKEHDEPKVDWTKIPVDTKILVSENGKEWHRRYFAEYKDERVFAWYDGITSWSSTNPSLVKDWKYAKLVEEED